jgi:tape measure domain-containing protein
MAAQVGNLQVRVGADIRGLQTGMTQAQRAVANSARTMKGEVKALQLTFADVATASSRAWRVFLGGAAVLGTARAVIGLTDAYKNLQAQLRLATSEYGNLTQAQRDVIGIAARSRSDLGATAELYAALQRNSGQLGATQLQVARVTETVSKAFKISGASADEAANATRQLVQAFQSGRLQGDEFRSLMENAPRLTRALADSIGITVGELRNLSKEGKLTSDTLIRAFSDARFTKPIDDEFAQLPVTFDQAMGQVYNAAVLTFGEFDRGGQFSTALANFVTDGTEGFASLSQAAYDFGATTRGFLDTLDAVRDAFGNLHTEGILGLTGLENATISLRGTIATLLGVLDAVANKFANLVNFPGNVIRQITGAGGKPIIDPFDMAGTFRRSTQKADLRAIASRGLDPSEWRLGKAPPAFRAPASGGGGGGGGKARKAPEDRSADVEAQFDRDMRQADMDVLRARQDLLHNADQRAEIEVQLLELERQNENAAIDEKVRRAQKDAADGRITESALKEVELEAIKLKAKNDEVTRMKRNAVLDELAHQKAEDAAKLAQTDYELQQDALQTQEDLATTASERREIELRLLDLSYRQEKARLEAVLADEQASEAAKEDARRRLAALNANYSNRVAGVMQRTGGPLEEWARSIPKTAAEINEALQSIEVQGLDGLSDAIAGVITGTKSLKDAFAELAQSIISDIIRMTVRMLIFKAISGIMGGGLGESSLGGGGIPTFSPSNPGVGFAGGGGFTILGKRGVDQNMLSLNGIPIANVSYGERLSVDRGAANDGGAREVTINQTYSFQGVAVTKDEFVQGLMFAKHDTIAAMKDMRRRGQG